ncbi:hypothetical protein WICMUC_003843 [Wickerhamomyces mucosus]|uniref:Coronin n=1 Tax=Wickerhamomyces mucosus TaxID=1378264 RepID=A0A9P8PKJ2_9ASCO|nr:hypothetical protein WICMUC_003843 [Wickerhamomyces mucosus]
MGFEFNKINWNSSGGGAFAVIPVGEVGKAPDKVSLFRGHTATVLDTDFNPFNDQILISGSDDGKLGLWRIPDDYSFHSYLDNDGEIKDVSPVALYSGHKRKVGHVQFHPTAENVAATSSLDYTVKLWDVENGKDKITLEHKDLVTSFSFNYNGNLLATTSRDRKLRVWDIRSNNIISEGAGHTGAKSSRIAWLGNSDRIATTGFSKLSDRQLGVWDAGNIDGGPIGGFYTIDASSGILVPFYDDSNKILYVGGKGDGNIRYYEFADDELFPLSEYQSTEPQRGLALAPKRTVNVKDNEVVKIYKTVSDTTIEPISFIVPRKSEIFQDDIYPDAPSNKVPLSNDEWFSGKSVDGPILFSLESLYNGSEPTFSEPTAAAKVVRNESKTDESTQNSHEASQPTTERAPLKTNVDDLLQKDEVNSLLKKAADLDGDKENNQQGKINEDEWEDIKKPEIEPANVKPIEEKFKFIESKEAESKKAEPKKAESKKAESKEAESKDIELKKAEPKEVEPESKQAQSEKIKSGNSEQESEDLNIKQKQSTEVPENIPNSSSPSTSLSTALNLSKPLTLKENIEKLTSAVLSFEALVSKLEAANLEKDERLKALEEKIEELLRKQ